MENFITYQIKNLKSQTCLDGDPGGGPAHVFGWSCDPNNPKQKWNISPAPGG